MMSRDMKRAQDLMERIARETGRGVQRVQHLRNEVRHGPYVVGALYISDFKMLEVVHTDGSSRVIVPGNYHSWRAFGDALSMFLDGVLFGRHSPAAQLGAGPRQWDDPKSIDDVVWTPVKLKVAREEIGWCTDEIIAMCERAVVREYTLYVFLSGISGTVGTWNYLIPGIMQESVESRDRARELAIKQAML